MQINHKYQQDVSFQKYTSTATIEGVEIIKGEYYQDDGGNFAEIARINSEGLVENLVNPFMIKQLSMSLLVPGVIKAYHIHMKQDDLWFVPPAERLLVNLHDIRENSPTFDQHMRFTLGGGKNMLVRIPHGVAHGVANPYERNMFMMYATSTQFNSSEPDEGRLPWDAFGEECWKLSKG